MTSRRQLARLLDNVEDVAPPISDVQTAREHALARVASVARGEHPPALSRLDTATLRQHARARRGLDLDDPEHVAQLRQQLLARLTERRGNP